MDQLTITPPNLTPLPVAGAPKNKQSDSAGCDGVARGGGGVAFNLDANQVHGCAMDVTAEETEKDNWACCDKCDAWHVLSPTATAPEGNVKWYCSDMGAGYDCGGVVPPRKRKTGQLERLSPAIAAIHQQSTASFHSMVSSSGAQGGLEGDVVFIKATAADMVASGFYFVTSSGGSFMQLDRHGGVVPLEATLGERPAFVVKDLHDLADVKAVVADVRKIQDQSRRVNPSLEVGLRAVMRHREAALQGKDGACDFAYEQAFKKRKATSPATQLTAQQEIQVDPVLNVWKRCFERCNFAKRIPLATY